MAGFLQTLTVGCEWFSVSSWWFLEPSIKKAFQPAQAPKNPKKKQTTRCTKPAQAPKKNKKTKPQQLVRKHGHRFGIFGFFGACAGLVMVALWFLWFFWCLPMFCEVKLTKPAQAPKKNKKNKPLDAPNLHRHQKNKKTKPQQLVRRHGHRFGIFVPQTVCHTEGFLR